MSPASMSITETLGLEFGESMPGTNKGLVVVIVVLFKIICWETDWRTLKGTMAFLSNKCLVEIEAP